MKESFDLMLISEWNGLSEQEIVSKVQDQVREALINQRFTVICGYNILRFDIPLLICRCVQYSLNKIDEIAKMRARDVSKSQLIVSTTETSPLRLVITS